MRPPRCKRCKITLAPSSTVWLGRHPATGRRTPRSQEYLAPYCSRCSDAVRKLALFRVLGKLP